MGDVAADLWQMSATELAGGIRHRQVSSREVVQAHLQRVEAVNPGVNAHHGSGGASGVKGHLYQMLASS
jgi:hypothetical protein